MMIIGTCEAGEEAEAEGEGEVVEAEDGLIDTQVEQSL